jgi:hypothetical protein
MTSILDKDIDFISGYRGKTYRAGAVYLFSYSLPPSPTENCLNKLFVITRFKNAYVLKGLPTSAAPFFSGHNSKVI